MKLKKGLFAIGVTAVLTLTFVVDAFAEVKTQEMEVNIKGGELSLEIPKLEIDTISDITLTKERDSYNIGFDDVFTIRDLTGTQAGWRLWVSATPLTEVDSNHQLPSDSLWVKSTGSITAIDYKNEPTQLPYVLQYPYAISSEGVLVANAGEGEGMGSFELSFPSGDALELYIDALTAKEGTYKSTITWSLVTAP